jgi:hypothetical protein
VRTGARVLEISNPAAGAGFELVPSTNQYTKLRNLLFSLATSATAANRQVAVQLLDNEGILAYQAGSAVEQFASATSTYEVSDAFSASFQASTPTGADLYGGGSATAPAAGATIANTNNGVAGTSYQVTVQAAVGQGGLAADAGNMELYYGTIPIAQLAVPAPGGDTFGPFTVINTTGANFNVKAINAGTASVPYSATISAVPVGANNGALNCLGWPDIWLPPGWGINVVVTNEQAADQISAITYTAEFGLPLFDKDEWLQAAYQLAS